MNTRPVFSAPRTLGATAIPAAASTAVVVSSAIGSAITGGLIGLLVGAIGHYKLGKSTLIGAGIGAGTGALMGFVTANAANAVAASAP